MLSQIKKRNDSTNSRLKIREYVGVTGDRCADLYEYSKMLRQEKLRKEKSKDECEFEKSKEECTFTPNLTKFSESSQTSAGGKSKMTTSRSLISLKATQ